MQMKEQLFVVIDGTDGSGKATQTQLLVERLSQEKTPVETISFPQYNTKSAGLVEEYLSGKYGTASEVSPKISSIFFAVDRFDASFKIRNWLKSGKTVITDRYVTSNMGHHGGKISDPEKRAEFFAWNADLEYNTFHLPRPDITIILHVPAKIAIQLAHDRGGWKADIDTDIHETDTQHMIDAEAAYLNMAKQFPELRLVECVKDGKLRSKEDIHNEIWQIITSYKN